MGNDAKLHDEAYIALLVKAANAADEALFDATHAIESVPDKAFGYYTKDAPQTAGGFERVPFRQELLSRMYSARDRIAKAIGDD